MAATETNTLLDEANCYDCYGEVSLAQSLKLALLARTLLAVNPSADTSAQALLAYAKCYSCFSGASMGDMLELALLDQISQFI